ncbi:bucky ball-like isoform X2 [Melanotaenia boesemani]|uniref:bucky ball-like isoform X2 n=1 Tax=Melanotaenia boesemani TaxID=1250792 RepID=UPI001C0435C1|nr:bucky ball-like isoform X2 [Melanotaenia boesemani]
MKMDDTGKPQSRGSGAQRNPHPRPFFYVQPASQPYYLQWQLNNPYSHYGLPGGFNIGRPCMHPYPFVPFPGFVLPHAPIYPMDYRRMFEPRFHPPSWGDMPRQQYHSQPYGRRETSCSEAQTDPSEAIAKLIECLDKIRTTELQAAERELDSGIASQASTVFSPEEKKNEEQGHSLPSALQDSCLETPAVTLSDTAVIYDESNEVILDPQSPNECWTGGLEEELPVDSSSVHEECPELEQSASDQNMGPLEKEVTDIQSNISVTNSSISRCDAEESTQTLSFPSSQTALKEAKSSYKVAKAGHHCDDAKADQTCHVLKLPFDNVLTPGAAGADHLSSQAAPYYYNYLSMQTTHERMSVLSPSLDELSSRDEMFSTDLDDTDLLPKHGYTGRRHAEVMSRSSQAAEDVEELWLPDSKRFACACCGKYLAKWPGRSKGNSSKMYRDEVGDSEEEGRYGSGCKEPVRVVVRKHSAPRKAHSLPPRLAVKPWHNRGQYKEPSDPVENDAPEVESGVGLELNSRELQCRTCQDKFCREDLTTADQGRWADGDSMPRRRQAATLQRQEMNSQWKLMYHRPREEDRDDDEPSLLHWERVRTEPRC